MTQSALDKELKALGAQHKNGASASETDEVTQLKERALSKIGAQVAIIDEERTELSSHRRKLGTILDKVKKSQNVEELNALLLDLRELGGEIPATPEEGRKMTILALLEQGRLETVEIGDKLYVVDVEYPHHASRGSSRRSRKARRQAAPAAAATPVVASAPVVPEAAVASEPVVVPQAAPSRKSFLGEALSRGKQGFDKAFPAQPNQ